MGKDFNETLNLPNTEFPMRANLPQREPEILKKWEDGRAYDKLLEKNEGKPLYILHDGPPYANGDMHIGHALNRVLKDVVVRYKNMTGFKSPFIPGWDTHGLPIEQQTIKKLGVNRHETAPEEYRKICREFALSYMNNQREQIKRLGAMGDWEHPYLTLHPEYEAKQIEIFGKMVQKGYIYKGLKPVYWCADCETALAEAEIEYKEDKTDSIYVKFAVRDLKGKLEAFRGLDIYFIIWTTTTWTLPGNLAICLNADFEYSLVKAGDEAYVVASSLLENTMKQGGISEYEVLGKFKGKDLEGILCRHPFLDRDSVVIVGDHVTAEAGTGCVHTAPGHGVEDFLVCKNYDIDVVVPVDDKGIMNSLAGKYEGLPYYKANKAILDDLKESGALFATESIIHQYPHCWRCTKPILFRATEQWFCSVKDFSKETLEEIKKVEWYPAWGEERIASMVSDRSDWCISRQRLWGVPIPIFYCEKCKKELINDETIKAVSRLFLEKSSDAWYTTDAADILPKGTKCSCGHDKFYKEKDIMDVWFDSGSSHSAVLETREGLKWPADMYLEGNDQYRGWFQSSLLTAVASKGKAPFKTVLTHGFVVDGQGRKMSKSLGNGVDPNQVINQYGADILRLWVVSSDYKVDVRLSPDILKQLSEVYRKIRNTARFILGAIGDFEPQSFMVPFEKMTEIDRFALIKLNELVKKVREAYDSYDYHIIFHSIHSFCVVFLSNFYLDVLKDRLYCERKDDASRRSSQSCMYKILDALIRMLSPVLCYTSEEIWGFMKHLDSHDTESVMFNPMPEYDAKLKDDKLCEEWDFLLSVREDVNKALELARAEKVIGAALEAELELYCKGDLYKRLDAARSILDMIFITSGVTIKEAEGGDVRGDNNPGLGISVIKSEKEKCQRCWRYMDKLDENALCGRCAEAAK